jgi:hypothetical protein
MWHLSRALAVSAPKEYSVSVCVYTKFEECNTKCIKETPTFSNVEKLFGFRIAVHLVFSRDLVVPLTTTT